MKHLAFLLIFIFSVFIARPQQTPNGKSSKNSFAIVNAYQATLIYTEEKDDWLVQKAALLFQQDVEAITGKRPEIVHKIPENADHLILIGTLEKNAAIQRLITEKKLLADSMLHQWEAYQVKVITDPFKGVRQALVIAGSDKRGTAFGVFDISQKIGVSPWYWWADVPIHKQKEIYLPKNLDYQDRPRVKYRGIFINDEAPAFSGWTHEKFGGFNHQVYEKVFELLLRLKANYLWPAMWGNAFNDDDTLNPVLADKYGIVMGTSHHEPMLRAQTEWKRYGKGAWNYQTNEKGLQDFWKKGIENMGTHESLVTIGMRGDGDEPMTTGTATALLERIVTAQRKILEEVTQKPASHTPQLWALYKEVQDYYDKGMRVPEDVTLLLCDDNWGNIRRLPKLSDAPRSGGYGIYYHFDYVGGPRNYKWINTNNISRVWEQMHLAYSYGVDKIWIVNVGDLKPMELPVSFFLDYAWNPEKITAENVGNYYENWASQQFGKSNAKEIGDLLQKYSQYASRRKPELLSPETYSLHHYDEANRVIKQYEQLVNNAENLNARMPAAYKEAFFQLILFPIKAFVNLNQLYVAVAKNKWLAGKKNKAANKYAEEAKMYFKKDSLLTYEYNHILAGGKWNHMMDQTHIGYTYWQQPPYNKMPVVTFVADDSPRDESVKMEIKDRTSLHYIPHKAAGNIFYEKNGYVSIEATHFSNKRERGNIQWKIIPNIGKDGHGISTFPVTQNFSSLNSSQGMYLEYDLYVYDSGIAKINAYFSPTLNFEHDSPGLQFAISMDNETPRKVSLNKEDSVEKIREKWVANNIIVKTTEHVITQPGKHTLRYWVISPGVILQKIVLDLGGLSESYLGPPETLYISKKIKP